MKTKVKKTIKKEKAVESASPSGSPPASPKDSPMMKKGLKKKKATQITGDAEETAKKESVPNKVVEEAPEPKKKKAKTENGDKPALSDAETKALSDQAVNEILKGIEDPATKEKCFVLDDWSTKYKPVLGPYKKFVKSHKDKFVIIDEATGNFFVRNAKDAGLPSSAHQNWTKLLLRAWSNYCAEVPKHERNVDNFMKPIPAGQRHASGKESPKVTPMASPKLESVASPKVAPAQASPKITPAQTSPKMVPTPETGKTKKLKKRKL